MLDQVREALPALGTVATACVLYLHFSVGRPRMRHGDSVEQTVFCLHCNWEGRVPRADARCADCGGRDLHVLAI